MRGRRVLVFFSTQQRSHIRDWGFEWFWTSQQQCWKLKYMENGFKILRKNNFQPRILNLAQLSIIRITTFSEMLDLKKSDSCRAGLVLK